MSINQFIIDGNVTKDVELRYTPRGTPVATYTVAVDDVYYSGDEKREETEYIPVTTYGRQAENDAKYLKKGSGVTVMGKIKSWYKPEQRKGGFNFEAEKVIYRGRPSSTPKSVQRAPEDDWLRDYDNAERSGNGASDAPGGRGGRS